ncbi:MAG: polysaccharide biosynthesis C-terminal domain-containing protein, partial [Clostridia bacterium]|nr:polysaccharide biosynthesis C-terminal domain-containing protein [Clostridia bacterium]
LLVVLFNILFLLIFKLGIIGYLISNILASLLVSLCCLFIIRPKWEKREKNDKELGRAMLAYSIPLIFNGVCWWANTSLDKFFIKYMLGDAQNGLYAVGTKIPGLLTLFQTIFNQAWTLSAIREFDKEDKDGFFSNIYRWYNAGITICCSFLIVFNYSFAKILYAKDFFEAWRISSILTLTIMFSGLSGIVGSVFSAVKNSRAYATSTIVAAVANAILNYFFINWLGIQGAAVSTVISFVIIWAIRLKLSQQYINMHFRLGRDIFTYIMLFLQVSLEQVIDHSSIHFYLIQGSVFLVIIIAYRGELQIITNRLFALVGGLVRENK